MRSDWRFGGDLGTNSLGWAAISLDGNGAPSGIIAMGSRIFSDGRDPKSGASLAMDRRMARAMRRRRDRFKRRQAALIKHLTLAGLFPDGQEAQRALETLDPFALRAGALHQSLPLHHVGRALFHLNQRRGFKSNRKTDRDDSEDGKVRIGVARLQSEITKAGAKTLGEYLHKRRAGAADPNEIPSVRTRLREETGDGAKGTGYDFYPDRQMLEDEFNEIWDAQAEHHAAVLTAETKDRLYEVIFHQRPLKRPRIGKCTLMPAEERLPKAHPLFQRRRLLEEVNALKIIRTGVNPEPLTREERDLLLARLRGKGKVSFKSLRGALKLDDAARFNKESDNRPDLKGDEIEAEFSAKTRFGGAWVHFSSDRQWEVIKRLRELESDADVAAFVAWLQTDFALTPEQAQATARARLPEGFGRFGETATTRLIEALKDEVIVYSEAVVKAGFAHHSDFRDGVVRDALPYYGEVLERYIMPGTGEPSDPDEMRIGRLTNPTVHIGLNQLRRVLNRLIKRYGPPKEIAIELARELKLDDERKREINTRNKKNREDAEQRSKKLGEIGLADKGGNRAILKLWEELNRDNVLDRRCIYTGTQISIDMLFSGAVEVDHILPFAATLDDSNGNKLLCMREANRQKRKRSPFDAFGHTPQWEEIAARAARLPREKRWRFEPEAMHRFDKDGGFLARQLIDTQYLSRLAREYVSSLYPEKGDGSSHVWVSPGRLTEMLRRSWGLNHLLADHNTAGASAQPKNRSDHRHHALDALVVAVTDRGLLKRIADESGQRGYEAANRMTADLPKPWETFIEDAREAIRNVTASHKADHGTTSKATLQAGKDQTAGRLHNETAYGLTGWKDEKGNEIVVHRVPIASLAKAADIADGEWKGVVDPLLRQALLDWTKDLEGKAFAERLKRFHELGPLDYRGIRRVRVMEPMASRTLVPVSDKTGRPFKAYKGGSNFRYDVWELKDGKWVSEVVSMFEAHRPGWTSAVRELHPVAKKVLSLKQGDLIAAKIESEKKLFRVVKFTQSGQITLAEPNEANTDARANDKADPFKFFSPTQGGLKKIEARQVRIDELGRVIDPGFPARTRKRPTRKG